VREEDAPESHIHGCDPMHFLALDEASFRAIPRMMAFTILQNWGGFTTPVAEADAVPSGFGL
jgi:hypothetical protein